MTLYSDEVRRIFRSFQWPKTLTVEIVEYEDYLGFRLFRDNFETFDGVDKQYIAGLTAQCIYKIRQTGIPCYMEVVKGDGKVVRRA